MRIDLKQISLIDHWYGSGLINNELKLIMRYGGIKLNPLAPRVEPHATKTVVAHVTVATPQR